MIQQSSFKKKNQTVEIESLIKFMVDHLQSWFTLYI